MYYDTTKLPDGFETYRLVATGSANWDYFAHPWRRHPLGGLWCFSVATQPDCASSSFGGLDWLRRVANTPDGPMVQWVDECTHKNRPVPPAEAQSRHAGGNAGISTPCRPGKNEADTAGW